MYNNYYGRQPYYMPNYQQQIMPQQLQQPVEVVFSDVRILTADQIKGFIPPINSKVLLIDKDNGLAYVETTDNMGNMYKQPYSFKMVQNEKKEEKQDFSNFATKDEQKNFATKDEIEAIKKEIETLRGEYGRANNQPKNQQSYD